MDAHVFSRRQAFCYRLLSILTAITMLFPALATPPPARAATGPQPGAVDPAANFLQWRNDEVFVTTPLLGDPQNTWYPYSRVYDASSDLTSLTLKEQVKHTAAADQHDAVAAAAGHILTPDHESVAQAYRNGSSVEVKVFGRPTASAMLANLAPRVTGSTDFLDIAAGDLDGKPAVDLDRRDEVVVAYAQPDAANMLPVQVAVLDFGDASEPAPAATAVTAATASAKLDASHIIAGPIKPLDNALAVATGDFDANGVQEIAVAYLVGPHKMNVDVFRYTVTVQGATVTRTLTRVGAGYVQISLEGFDWVATLSAVAGDFDGDGRAELALGTTHYVYYQDELIEAVRIFRFTGDATLTVTEAKTVVLKDGAWNGASGRVRLAAGLFKYDPANGWGSNRRQLAVAYTDSGTSVLLRTIEFGSDLTPQLNPAHSSYIDGPFWLAAGGFNGFKGDLTQELPTWSLTLMSWSPAYEWSLAIYQTAAGAAPVQKAWMYEYTLNAPASGARLALVAYDRDGDTVYLGAPVHFTVYNLVNADFILQEPPKHVYWDPVNKRVVNVSRYDGFNISLISQSGQQFTSDSTDTSSFAMGTSESASASATVGAGMNIGIAKASASVTTEAAATLGQDYSQNASTYNSQFGKRTVGFSGETNRDDFIVGRLQALDIWRYRVRGFASSTAQSFPFIDIVLPGPVDTISTQGGALNFDWYQPTHENGNILSYPALSADTVRPPDLGSFKLPDGTSVTALMYPPTGATMLFFDGNSGTNWLQFSEESGGGTTRSYSHTLSENASFKTSASVSAKAFGVTAAATASLGVELSQSNSWGNTATSNNLTSSSTEIKLSRPAGQSDQAYGFYPLIYVTTDGTIKATYAVSPLASDWGKEFWLRNYSLPDLALNLPRRLIPTSTNGVWVPSLASSRKAIRGFFVRKYDPNPVTGAYDQIAGAVRDGAVVRLETRVYNYSVGMGVPAGGRACFSYATFDPTTYQEGASRTQIGCATLPALNPQAMATASVVWNTAGLSGAGANLEQQYRIYVNLTAPTGVTEHYPPETDT